MSEQEAVWYFSQHGERKGPVTLEVLKNAVSRGKLDLEKDLVWGPGLANWSKVAEVPELQGVEPVETAPPTSAVKPLSTQPASAPAQPTQPSEPVAPAVEKKPAAPAKPKVQPAAEADDPYKTPSSIDDDTELTDALAARRMAQGSGVGIGRLKYFFYPLLVGIVLGVIKLGVTGVLADTVPAAVNVVAMITAVISIAANIYFIIARLHNLSMSGWAILWNFVPFMNIWVNWRLIACPAEYAKHKKLDGAGKVLTALCILGVLAFIGFIGYVVSLGPEQLELLQKFLEEQSGQGTDMPNPYAE